MKRIDSATAVPDLFGPGKNGFTDGNALTGVAATKLNAKFFNGVQEALVRVQEAASLVASDDPNQFVEAIVALINARSSGHSISSLPSSNIGAITVIEAEEIWRWSASSFFNGYRSQLCGRAVLGHTTAPLPCEFDATGGLLPKLAYARVWGYAQENGLVVTQSVWTANIGAHYFVDVDATFFRCPDLRNMFPRFTGTDADTANARTLGSRQLDALQNITGGVNGIRAIPGATATGAASISLLGASYTTGASADYPNANFSIDASRVCRTSVETRGKNTAFHPRIHA